MTKLQILALLLASLALLFFTSCDSEDFQEPDVYKVTPDLRLRINQGMKLSSKSERRTFKEKFDLFQEKCDEMDHITSPWKRKNIRTLKTSSFLLHPISIIC